MQSPLALVSPGVEGRWPCRILVVHVSPSCTASSARTLVHVAQTVPQVRAVPNIRFLTLTCHRDDTGASGRRVSFKLPGWLSSSRVGSSVSCESRFRQNTAREGMSAACSQRVMVPSRRFQAMRPSVSRLGGQSHQVPRVRTVLVHVPAASWECWDHGIGSQAGTPCKGRPTQKLASD